MANSDWFTLTNNGLRQAGLSEISDRANFLNAARLTRYQLCMREYVRHAHAAVFNDMPAMFAQRRIAFNIFLGQSVYPLDTGISAENITFNSFRNITPGATGDGRIRNWSYEEFTEQYNDTSLITTGRPERWIMLPIERTDLSVIYNIRIFPNPDQTYNLEYIAQLNPYELTADDSIVLLPPEYNHVLEDFARGDLEDILGEGKAGSLQIQAERNFKKMRKKVGRPVDERKAVRMKTYFRSGRYSRQSDYYDSPTD